MSNRCQHCQKVMRQRNVIARGYCLTCARMLGKSRSLGKLARQEIVLILPKVSEHDFTVCLSLDINNPADLATWQMWRDLYAMAALTPAP